MPEIPETCEFEITPEQIIHTIQANGDHIEFKGVNLCQGAAAALAWMVNIDNPAQENKLTIEIKVKV